LLQEKISQTFVVLLKIEVRKKVKKIVLLVVLLNLIGCLQDNPCEDIRFELNEPGGFGRNEVTCLIDGEEVWHSTGGGGLGIFQNTLKDEDGKRIKDSLNNSIYLDEFSLSLETVYTNTCVNYYFNNFHLEFGFWMFNEKSSDINNVRVYLRNYFLNNNKPGYSNTNAETFKSNVYWNRKDSIIHGTFEGVLYNYSRTDSIKITNGVFDFSYKSRNFHGEIK